MVVWAATWGPPPQVAKKARFLNVPRKKFHSAWSGYIFQFLAFWTLISILAFYACISFHFRLLGLHFFLFWPFGPSFPFILNFWAFISFYFGLLGLHFLSFWPFGLSFPFILAFWALIAFHFGLSGHNFFLFWPFGPSFPFILAFWAFISFHFGLLGLYFFHFEHKWSQERKMRP